MDNLIELLDRGYLYDGKTVYPGKINEALAAVTQSIGAIGKDQKNTFDGYKFRGIDDLYNALHVPLGGQGVAFVLAGLENVRSDVVETKKGGTQYRTVGDVVWHATAPDGSYRRVVARGVGMDRSDKDTGKMYTSAFKVVLFELFMIPTDEQAALDPDRESPEIAAPRPIKTRAEREAAEMAVEKRLFWKWYSDWRQDFEESANIEYLTKVSGQVLSKPKPTTVKELHRLWDLLEAGEFDRETGEPAELDRSEK